MLNSWDDMLGVLNWTGGGAAGVLEPGILNPSRMIVELRSGGAGRVPGLPGGCGGMIVIELNGRYWGAG